MKNKLILLFLLSLPCLLTAQNFDKARLDEYFETLADNNKFMGSVAVAHNGNIIYQKAIGFADAENKKKADTKTKYRIGSITKTFTATLVMKAVEENKLKLNETLEKYYPQIKNADSITIEHLLSHRSGIHSFTNDEEYDEWNEQAKTEKELIEIIAKGESVFEPGSKAEYSNPNYILLSFILQKIYKKTYADLLKEKITKPLGLSDTYFGSAVNVTKNEANSYRYNSTWEKETETHTSIPMGAGGIVSTATDLVKFAYALFSG